MSELSSAAVWPLYLTAYGRIQALLDPVLSPPASGPWMGVSAALGAGPLGAEARATPLTLGMGPDPGLSDVAPVLSVRPKLRAELETLRRDLGTVLEEREGYLALFPLVVYLDELIVRRCYARKKLDWPLLQLELFRIDNGGDMFYDLIELELVGRPVRSFLCEVYYFFLSEGFVGRHVDDPAMLEHFRSKLVARMTFPELPAPVPRPAGASLMLRSVPWRYYLLALAFILVLPWLLLGISNL